MKTLIRSHRNGRLSNNVARRHYRFNLVMLQILLIRIFFLPLKMKDDRFCSALKAEVFQRLRKKKRKERIQSSLYPLQQTIYKNSSIPFIPKKQTTHCNILLGADPTLNNLAFKIGSPPPSSDNLNCEIISRRSTIIKMTINQETLNPKKKKKLPTHLSKTL